MILFVNIIVTIKRISEIEYKRQKEESDRLRNQTERVSLQMMKTLAATIEAKDDYMRGHSYRVAEYSALIAKQLGWSEHDVENLRNAAYLHDIGKIGVPDTILNKPTRLTDEEFAAIKSHTSESAKMFLLYQQRIFTKKVNLSVERYGNLSEKKAINSVT